MFFHRRKKLSKSETVKDKENQNKSWKFRKLPTNITALPFLSLHSVFIQLGECSVCLVL